MTHYPEKRATLVAVFETAEDARHGVEAVRRQVPEAAEVSAMVRSKHDLVTLKKTMERGDSSEHDAALGAGIGGLIGLFAGAVGFMTMGLGAILIAGPAAALTGSIVGGLVGAMVGWGVPHSEAKRYEGHLDDGRILVLLRADPEDIAAAMRVLGEYSPVTLDLHAASDAESPEIDDRAESGKLRHS